MEALSREHQQQQQLLEKQQAEVASTSANFASLQKLVEKLSNKLHTLEEMLPQADSTSKTIKKSEQASFRIVLVEERQLLVDAKLMQLQYRPNVLQQKIERD